MKVIVKKINKEFKAKDSFEIARKNVSKAMKRAGIKKKISPSELDIADAYNDLPKLKLKKKNVIT